jgi:hypothetical protein
VPGQWSYVPFISKGNQARLREIRQMTEHLVALQARLSNEKSRLNSARTKQERELRAVWVKQMEREIDGEMRFLGLPIGADVNMTDDELLAALAA